MDDYQQTRKNWPSVSVLITNWNGRDLLSQSLPPLLKQDYPAFDITLIDNGSTDDSVSFVRQQFPLVRIIGNKEDFGLNRRINVGLQEVTAEIVVLLKNDVFVQPDWLRRLVEPLRDDSSIGVAGCKLLSHDGKTIPHLGFRLSYPLAFSEREIGDMEDGELFEEITDVTFVSGSALAITREALTTVGLFDEEFSPNYFEEADYCARVRQSGLRVVVVPQAVGICDESGSAGRLHGLQLQSQLQSFHRSRLLYVLKHYRLYQFLDHFVPAEMEWMRLPESAVQLPALRQAYLEMLLAAANMLIARGEGAELPEVQEALLALRTAAQDAEAAANESVSALPQRQGMVEPPFRSTLPVIGPAVAAFRRLWNSVAAKWYVRGVMDQQVGYNRLVTDRLTKQLENERAAAREMDLLLDELLQLRQEVRQLQETLHRSQEEADQETK